jgi:uncharacterized protein
MKKIKKTIIDTNIFISAFVFDRNPEKILNIVYNSGKFKNYLSLELFREIEEKFYNGRVEKICKKIDLIYDFNNAKNFIEDIRNYSTITNPPTSLKINSCRDPEDNMILELASFVDVDYIVTGDKDLLILNPFKYRNKEFGIDCKIEIVDIKEFVELLEG